MSACCVYFSFSVLRLELSSFYSYYRIAFELLILIIVININNINILSFA